MYRKKSLERSPKKNDGFSLFSIMVLTAYFFAVSVLRQLLNFSAIVLWVPLSVVIAFWIVQKGKNVIDNITFSEITVSKKFFWSISVLTVSCYLVYFFGAFPGGFSPDSICQYEQAIGSVNYSDWHPVLHTLLFFTLPLKIFGSYKAIVALQLVYFGFAFGYLVYILGCAGIPKRWLIFFCGYIWFNPFLIVNMMYPWKDIAFLIVATVMLTQYFQIICSRGEWLKKRKNALAFAAFLVFGTVFRHNGILFTLPLLVSALFYSKIRGTVRIRLSAFFVVIFVLVKMLYFTVGVESPENRKVETLGLPISVWCNVMKETPNSLPNETRDFMYSVCDETVYDSFDCERGFNSIKYNDKIHLDVLDSVSYIQALKYTSQCFAAAPMISLQAVASLTNFVWNITNELKLNVVISPNQYGIDESPNQVAAYLSSAIQGILPESLQGLVFGSYGVFHILIIVVAALLFAKKRTSFVHAIPLLCYNFGTMLFLSGQDSRFFAYSIVLWIPTVLLMLKDTKTFSLKTETQLEEVAV